MTGLVAHLDADCFYVSAERVRHPELAGKPVGVLGNNGACVIAKNYEMRAAAVKTGTPIWDAKALCPEGVYVKRDFYWYEVLSRRMLDAVGSFSPLVEYYSIDEFFFRASPRLGNSPTVMAAAIRDHIRESAGLVLFALTTLSPADGKLKGIACRSVHLAYQAPEGTAFYNEATVRASADGTYFMVCGWGKGYFGLQELATGKKVALFSVWDPAAGDDPRKVPEEERVKTLHTGAGVRVGRFGNEGTGGQAFLDLDWRAGETYRFLVTARPDGPDRTAYGGYLYLPKHKKWHHLVTFSTPTKGELLKGCYSFVEDFRRNKVSTTKVRKAVFGNGWVKPEKGEWQPLVKAQFTADSNPVLNIDAGPAKKGFFLATRGGTENKTTKLGEVMSREEGGEKPPADLPKLGGP